MITLNNLTKKFGDFTAVENLSLTINTGEFFGLLGPNGAGKTTTIGMLSTILLPTSGEVLIDGNKLTRTSTEQKAKLSLVTQEYSMRQDMTVGQVMDYHGRLYHMSKIDRRKKTDELLEFSDLLEFKHRTVRHLSGGMKRKLMICRALLTQPQILLLDEPTAGMDALSRRQMWSLLKKLNSKDLTIILTTHYMEEAESLCERIALISKGKLDTIDSPENLINELGAFCVALPDNEEENKFFKTKEEAINYLSTTKEFANLRATTLEDVFLSRIGDKLTKK